MSGDELFFRADSNPILTARDIPYRANAVFNAGAALVGTQTVLLLRVEDCRGMSHFARARSTDGIGDWIIDREPAFTPDPENFPEEEWGIEDPRITFVPELNKWAVVYCAFSHHAPVVSMAFTEDFRTYDRLGMVLPPENKDAALFPEQIDGRWVLMHRPVPYRPGSPLNMWLAFSPDLRHWGDHTCLLEARSGAWWDACKIGLSAQPMRTSDGWLILYHGVRETVSGSIYRQGLALLDLKDPRKVLARSSEWVFGPEKPYERVGDVDNVTFSGGWLLRDGTVYMYYGGADSCMCLATAPLERLLASLR